MHAQLFTLAALAALAFPGRPAAAQPAPHIGRYDSHPDELQAIQQVADAFQAALKARDTRALSALFLNNRILFSTPASPAWVRQRRLSTDVLSDGIGSAGVSAFIDFVATAKVPIEERFHNIRITQDGHIAWMMFDFEFIEDGTVQNHGLEVWQLVKTPDERWKILSVLWSSHGRPN